MPVTRPAPGASFSYMSHAASGESSRKGEPGIEQPVDALAHRQLALLAMPLEILGAAALAAHREPVAELLHEAGEMLAIRVKFRGVGVESDSECGPSGFEQTRLERCGHYRSVGTV